VRYFANAKQIAAEINGKVYCHDCVSMLACTIETLNCNAVAAADALLYCMTTG